jgi:DNA-directed RNA polymerase II subunit RPB1
MTTRGQLTSISRHGINRVVDGPFRRATFEESVEILFGAAVFSEQ